MGRIKASRRSSSKEEGRVSAFKQNKRTIPISKKKQKGDEPTVTSPSKQDSESSTIYIYIYIYITVEFERIRRSIETGEFKIKIEQFNEVIMEEIDAEAIINMASKGLEDANKIKLQVSHIKSTHQSLSDKGRESLKNIRNKLKEEPKDLEETEEIIRDLFKITKEDKSHEANRILAKLLLLGHPLSVETGQKHINNLLSPIRELLKKSFISEEAGNEDLTIYLWQLLSSILGEFSALENIEASTWNVKGEPTLLAVNYIMCNDINRTIHEKIIGDGARVNMDGNIENIENNVNMDENNIWDIINLINLINPEDPEDPSPEACLKCNSFATHLGLTSQRALTASRRIHMGDPPPYIDSPLDPAHPHNTLSTPSDLTLLEDLGLNSGNAPALEFAAVTHARGDPLLGIPQNTGRARELFGRLAEGDDSPQAIYNLGILCLQEVPPDYGLAFEYVERAARLNFTLGIVTLGGFYYQGVGCSRNETHGIQLYEVGVGRGSVQAMVSLGEVYLQRQDITRALEYFEMASELGSVDADLNIGSILLNYQGRCDEAVRKFLQVMRSIGSQSDIKGYRAYKDQQYSESLIQYILAGLQGSTKGLYAAGYILENNISNFTCKLSQCAIPFYYMGSILGDVKCMERLAYLYFYGVGVGTTSTTNTTTSTSTNTPTNYKLAFHFYEKLSRRNVSIGVYTIGRMYEEGLHVDKDYHKANQYYSRLMGDGLSEEGVYINGLIARSKLWVKETVEGVPVLHPMYLYGEYVASWVFNYIAN